MPKRQPWIEHIFNLDIDVGWTDNVMLRIKDCPIRIQYHCQDLTDEHLSIKTDNKWSIKEHIGHLIDLEELWCNRFKQFGQFVPELVHADMSNQKTKQASHNDKSINQLIDDFTSERKKLIGRYNSLSLEVQNHSAIHPRIQMPMKPVDLLFFVAEHDDHHITSISLIKGNL